MYSVSFCAAIHGIEGRMIQVEADVSNGLPGFSLVGFLSSEVKEARERVQIGMRNAGVRFPPKKITINLSPADIRKDGTGYDLAIAVSILAAFGYVSQEYVKKFIFIGELGLEGQVKSVSGVLPRVYTAFEHGIRYSVVPKENVSEAGIVKGMGVIGVSSLEQLVQWLQQENLANHVGERGGISLAEQMLPDFSQVCGQRLVRRAVEVAAAGMHNLLMIGPPGSGKTMIAKCIPGILPQMDFGEQMEISKIYSVAGLLSEKTPYVADRPFREPHHTVTRQALVGGGRTPRPGEISLASGGVLFLDEMAEFHRQTIDLLRQPLEEGFVNVTRLEGNYRYPAKCQLIAATNPCRCGFYPDRKKCTCTPGEVHRYLDKISKPILERMDLCVETVPLELKDFAGGKKGENESSAEIRKRVERAHAFQQRRYEGQGFCHNAALPSRLIERYCPLEEEAEEYLNRVFEGMDFSARVYHKILKVSRTIADLAGAEAIGKDHVMEAVCYRTVDRKYWGREGRDGQIL
ncbi:MAG: YifB family Mg chelatase-like AAA ATPase [Lachnospiraceae bacterium]|nr:YifB family Mg chelatase-like AAA ATPase [Lachnospiraceae bacterium]